MPAQNVEAILAKMKAVETQQEEIERLTDALDADLSALDREIKSLPMQDLDPADRKLLIEASVALITKSFTKAAERASRRVQAAPSTPAPTGGFPRFA